MTRFTTHYMTHSKLVFGQECCDIKGNIVDFDGEEDEVDFDGETYNENQKMPSALIANNIIAERWNSTPNTIETYCK